MQYLMLNIEKPVEYVSGGRFITEIPWSHSKRIIDSFEIIIGINETLYIEQDSIKYEVKPGQTLLLFPHHLHHGYKICNKHVSFYWFHFLCPDALIKEQISKEAVMKIRTDPFKSGTVKDISIPKFATPNAIQRLYILSNQLLHVDNSHYYTRLSMDYLLTSLLIELSEQTISQSVLPNNDFESDFNINRIMEWTRVNSHSAITVADVAEKFSYHKDYLSRFFKQKTGKTLQEYIHSLKISKAKDLLTGTQMNIKAISNQVGIMDEKYFMRLFKKYEKMTPSQYRKAYGKIHFNSR